MQCWSEFFFVWSDCFLSIVSIYMMSFLDIMYLLVSSWNKIRLLAICSLSNRQRIPCNVLVFYLSARNTFGIWIFSCFTKEWFVSSTDEMLYWNDMMAVKLHQSSSTNLLRLRQLDQHVPSSSLLFSYLWTFVDWVLILCRNDKGDTVSASYYHTVKPVTNTAVGAELTHSFSSNENTLTIGTQHLLDPLTTVKARVNSYGKASALIQHEWRPKSLFTISGEVDTRAIEKSAKIGLAVALKPWVCYYLTVKWVKLCHFVWSRVIN